MANLPTGDSSSLPVTLNMSESGNSSGLNLNNNKQHSNQSSPSDSGDVAMNNRSIEDQGMPTTGKNKLKVPFVNLFKQNRLANESCKLKSFAPGTNTLTFSFDDIDTVEKTYGHCLLGYVISGRPSSYAFQELVKRWGKDVRFQTHESGWIVFSFPTSELRDEILCGGPYLIQGYHLFIKEMPRCFRFREDELKSVPAWVQIHGLPPDCWNHFILSNIASELGSPIHMDLLTQGRKRMKFARVLVEIDVAIPRVHDIKVVLPTGTVDVHFVYEQEIKFCTACLKAGHVVTGCSSKATEDTVTHPQPPTYARHRSKSVVWHRDSSRGRERFTSKQNHAPPRHSEGTSQLKDGTAMMDSKTADEHSDHTAVPCTDIKEKIDKGKGVIESEFPLLGENSKHATVVEEPFIEVTSKKPKKKSKAKKKKPVQGKEKINKEFSSFLDDLADTNSADTEYRQEGNTNMGNRFFGNENMGRQPKIASVDL